MDTTSLESQMTADLTQAKREHEAVDHLEDAISNYENVFHVKLKVTTYVPPLPKN